MNDRIQNVVTLGESLDRACEIYKDDPSAYNFELLEVAENLYYTAYDDLTDDEQDIYIQIPQ